MLEEEIIPSVFSRTENYYMYRTDKLSPCQTTLLCQVYGKMFYLPKLIFTIDGSIVCKEGATLCHGVGTKW